MESGVMANALIPCSASLTMRPGASRSFRFTMKITMFVCTLARSITIPGRLARPSARIRVFSWSSRNRSTIVSSATTPAAARMPACRMPPPNIFRARRARSMKARVPTTTDPTGAPSPLDRQKVTESAWAANSRTGAPVAMLALKIRAPSRCTAIPLAVAIRRISRRASRG